jgi:hypothetical protein
MSFEIGPEVFAAFEAEVEAQELRDFMQWWNARTAVLGAPLSLDNARTRLAAARVEGREIGLIDNEDNRLFLQAAAIRLLPQPSAEQWLLATDAVFAPDTDDTRLAQIAALSGTTR